MDPYFIDETLHWVAADDVPRAERKALAKRKPDGPEEVVGWDDRVEGTIYMYRQRKAKVTRALQTGLLGITFDTKEALWYRNCVPAADLEPVPEKKSRKKAAPK